MSLFLRLLTESDKRQSLETACAQVRQGKLNSSTFDVSPDSFDAVPGKPFAYWVSPEVRQAFVKLSGFESEERTARVGLQTSEDFRFVRTCWESSGSGWVCFAKGGAFSKFYADVYLLVNWDRGGETLGAFSGSVIRNPDFYARPGLTWPRRTTSGISLRVMPAGCIFGDKGPAAFFSDDKPDELLALLAVANSRPFSVLMELQLAAADAAARSYEVGVIQKTPLPSWSTETGDSLATLARCAWSLKRTLDTVTETSHAFLLPASLRSSQGDYDPFAIEIELARIHDEIDEIVFELYEFTDIDRQAALGGGAHAKENSAEPDEEDAADEVEVLPVDALLSWAVGVAFGRFDYRLATGERQAPAEPQPFDPLPVKSPGMLPDGTTQLHTHAGILVDDQGHPHDLTRIVEGVLDTVDAPVTNDVRRWLQKDFFVFHLRRYSKSRRKAPIYWPLATASGSYTLWLYYPGLTDQTLFSAVNDFVDPKLNDVRKDLGTLRGKGASRTKQEEKDLETLSSLEHELADLRDSLLEIAPNYRPMHDDGVQITAAPLWKLFRHKPWQKVLKDTWAKLEKGDYDWAHLAMSYWPDRVREKCSTDKSLAIAHDLEHLYIEPEPKPAKARGRAKKQDA